MATKAFALSVKVSDWHPSRCDATDAFQAALDSGADEVLVDLLPFDYVLRRTIRFRGNQRVLFEKGVCVRAGEGAFHGVQDVLMVADGVSNLVICGEGMPLIQMNKSEYQDATKCRHSEHRHLLVIVGCENVTVRGLRLASSGGSGIYISGNKEKPASKEILIEDVVSEGHHREACFVVSVEGLTIRRCRFVGTKGWPTQLGIDLEPNTTREMLVGILLEDICFENNVGGGLGIGANHALAKPISCTVRNCSFIDNEKSAILVWPWGDENHTLHGEVNFEKCVIRQKRNIPIQLTAFRGGFQVHFRECLLDNSKGNASAFRLSTDFADDMTGIDLGDFRVLQNEAHPVFQIGQLGAASLEAPTGHLTVEVNGEESQFDLEALAREHRGNPALRSFVTLPCNLEGLIPVSSKGSPDDSLRVRGSHRFLLYGKGGEEMEVLFTIPVLMPTWEKNLRVPIFLRDSKGNLVDSFQMNGERSLPYRFTPQADGVYQFVFENWNSMNVRSAAPGQGYDASRRLGLLGDGKWRSMYFWVPAGLEEIAIEVWGDVEEPVQAKLFDAEGRLAGELEYEFGTRLLMARRSAGGAEELWRLDIRGFQDHAIRLGRPLPPFIFTSRENALRIPNVQK